MHLISYSAFGRAIGAFALTRIRLPTPAQAPSVLAHHILLIDASGSMWGDMDQMQATLLRIFTATELQAPHLRVSLLSYSSSGDVITHFTRASVAELQAVGGAPQRTMKALAARGLTCISQALRAAVGLVQRGETTCVSLHTDGWANDPSPASERRALLAAVDDLRATGAWLSGIAYRTSSDFGLLSELAARCGGNAVLAASTRQVYDAIHSSTARAAGHVEPPVSIDVRIERELAHSALPELWAERDGWAEERDALVDALALLEAIPSLPRCGCGKIVHETPDSAQRHVRLLSLINDRPPAGDLPPLGIYGDCPVRRHPGWHVGHHAERR